MPVYEYECPQCKAREKFSRSIMESDPGYDCSTCNLKLIRVYSNIGVTFNGRGFYSTDKQVILVIEETKQEQVLTAMDRCDSCGAQAYVQVKGITGELLFCSHHYHKIMDSPIGYEKMMGFVLEVLDERDRLTENRLKEGD